MENTYYAITTFGHPDKRFRKVHTDKSKALKQASEMKGSGTCSTVHVLAFSRRAQAADADISDHSGRDVRGEVVAIY